jgi:hypothetical protein
VSRSIRFPVAVVALCFVLLSAFLTRIGQAILTDPVPQTCDALPSPCKTWDMDSPPSEIMVQGWCCLQVGNRETGKPCGTGVLAHSYGSEGCGVLSKVVVIQGVNELGCSDKITTTSCGGTKISVGCVSAMCPES